VAGALLSLAALAVTWLATLALTVVVVPLGRLWGLGREAPWAGWARGRLAAARGWLSRRGTVARAWLARPLAARPRPVPEPGPDAAQGA
jgi:hypothetical protein